MTLQVKNGLSNEVVELLLQYSYSPYLTPCYCYLFSRLVKNADEILKKSVFTVSDIGSLAYDDANDGQYAMLTNLAGKSLD